jgi:DNA-binding response OmpR family regulator
MKKVLIIEDDQVVGNVYRNKLTVDGYEVQTALDGETGLKLLLNFQPDLIMLDLILPNMSGIEVIRAVRNNPNLNRVPVIVLSNTYLTNLVQDAWKAGATKCLSKSSCSPQEVLELVHSTIGDSGAILQAQPAAGPDNKNAPVNPAAGNDVAFQADLRKTFVNSLPATLSILRQNLQGLTRADNETNRLKLIHELYRRAHAINGNAGIAGLVQIAHMSAALEALLKELYEKPKNINQSTLRTIAAAVDFLGTLFERGIHPDAQQAPSASVLVVDDEAISRRAVVYALEKAHLKSVNLEDPLAALKMATENNFDLIFLDVDMPGMNGFELCTRLRNLDHHKRTPVVFVTSLNDFDSRTSSMMAGGNDFIAKPFLFIELTVKAMIHILRAKLPPKK